MVQERMLVWILEVTSRLDLATQVIIQEHATCQILLLIAQTDSDNQTIIGQYQTTCDQEARQTLQIELDLVLDQIATTQEIIVSCHQTTNHLISEAGQTQESLQGPVRVKMECNLQAMDHKIVYHPEREISSHLLDK